MGSKRNKQITCLQFHYDVFKHRAWRGTECERKEEKERKEKEKKEGGREGKRKRKKKTSSKAATEKDLNKKEHFDLLLFKTFQ